MVDSFLIYQSSRQPFRIINIKSGAIKTSTVQDREDFHNFIDASDLLDLIFKLIEIGPSISVTEVVAVRSKH